MSQQQMLTASWQVHVFQWWVSIANTRLISSPDTMARCMSDEQLSISSLLNQQRSIAVLQHSAFSYFW